MKPDFEKMATEILGFCTCMDAYKDRGLVDPQCTRCNNLLDATVTLREAYAAGYRDGQARMRAAAGSVCDRFDEYALAGQVLDIQIEEPPT